MSGQNGRIAIVTGASSGIGDAAVRELLRREWQVVGIARRAGAIQSPRYIHLQFDLGELANLGKVIEAAAGDLVAAAEINRVGLVNNAADPGLLGPIERLDPVKLLEVTAVNVAAPTWLMGWIVRRTRPDVALRIVNVSSGAAVRAFAGLGAYGSSKAALRMAGMVLGTELDSAERRGGPRLNATILSYEPGTVDTPMQANARSATVETLPSVALFEQFAAQGRLVPPARPAAEIADYLESDGQARFTERRYA